MADILTHALAGYVLATMLSFRYEWLTAPYVTLCMMGALIPDTMKISLLVSSAQVEAWLGVPFSWSALHTLGGAIVAVLVGVALVPASYRRRVGAVLMLGALSHHALDVLIVHPSGYVYDVFWPLYSTWIPAGSLYHSSDRLPLAIAAVVATVTWATRERLNREQP